MENKKERILLIFFCILLPFFLLLFSYKIVLYFSELGAEQEEVINYLESEGELKLNYTSAEISHLKDVKEVMEKTDYTFYFLLLACGAIFAYKYKDKKYLKKLLLWGGGISAGLFVLFSVLALTGFNFWFEVFHQVFFPQGNWVFPGDSLLIQTFPASFFVLIVGKIAVLSLILASLFIGGGVFLGYERG